MIARIPDSIFSQLINGYLLQDDYQQLLNTSIKEFGILRKKTILYSLNNDGSLKYLKDESFRNALLEKVENPLIQIRVTLDTTQLLACLDKFAINPVYLRCRDLAPVRCGFPYIPALKEIDFDYEDSDNTDPIDLSTYSDVQSVRFVDFDELRDLSPLSECPRIELHRCHKIQDFSCLRKQKFLFISESESLKDVRNFQNIKVVCLRQCENLIDVSPLFGVYDLSLIGCQQVRDISGLGNHQKINISFCSYFLQGYDALQHIPHVRLEACNISNVSCLRYAKSVSLEYCGLLADVSPLKGIERLTLTGCSNNLRDISSITVVPNLKLDEYLIDSTHSFDKTKNLSILCGRYETKRIDIFHPAVNEIHICNNDALEAFFLAAPKLHNLVHVTFCDVGKGQEKELKILNCENIPKIQLIDCIILSMEGLGRNREVRMIGCRGKEKADVSNLKNVPIVYIKNCQGFIGLESLVTVPRLKLEGNK